MPLLFARGELLTAARRSELCSLALGILHPAMRDELHESAISSSHWQAIEYIAPSQTHHSGRWFAFRSRRLSPRRGSVLLPYDQAGLSTLPLLARSSELLFSISCGTPFQRLVLKQRRLSGQSGKAWPRA